MNELLDFHNSEFNSEDLMELGKQMEIDENGVVVLLQFTIKSMGSAFEALEKAVVFFEDQDPNVERFAKVHRAVEDAVSCYREIQTTPGKRTGYVPEKQFFFVNYKGLGFSAQNFLTCRLSVNILKGLK